MPTSLLTNSKTSHIDAGMTLIEVMVVLALIAFLATSGLNYFRRDDNNVKKVTRELSVLGKEVRSYARLKSQTYRIAISLDEGKQSYWVESAPRGITLLTEKEEQDLLDKTKSLNEKEKPPPAFHTAGEVMKKPHVIPPGINIEQVETQRFKQPIKTGTAYIHFFADGMVEQAAVQISMGKDKQKVIWTLVFNPLTGQADIVTEAKSLRDLSPER